jgi:hypothetical protein
MERRNPNLVDDPCARLEELLPAYGLGLSDPDEAHEVEALLERCPEMAVELEEYRQLAAHLPFTMEAKSAPPHLLTQILVAAASDSDQLEFTNTSSSMATRRVPRLTVEDTAGYSSNNVSSNNDTHSMQTVKAPRLPNAVVNPDNITPKSRTRSTTSNFWRSRALISSIAAAIALLLFVGANLLWSARVNQQETTLEEANELIQTFGDNTVIRFDMSSVDEQAPEARGTVWCRPDNRVALVKAENLPVEAQDQDLKVVLWKGDQREEAGDVWINDSGEGTAVITASQPMFNYDYMVIAQPATATGTQQPRPFMRGNLYYGVNRSTEDPSSWDQ